MVMRLKLHQLEADGTRDDTTYLRGDGTWATPDGSGPPATTVYMPLTSVFEGEPVLVWDDNDSLIPTEVPL